MITVNLNKAKIISHEKRRESRSKEFAPFDEIIMKQIPGNDYNKAEEKREEIRNKYSDIQTQIDEAKNVDELKNIIETFK